MGQLTLASEPVVDPGHLELVETGVIDSAALQFRGQRAGLEGLALDIDGLEYLLHDWTVLCLAWCWLLALGDGHDGSTANIVDVSRLTARHPRGRLGQVDRRRHFHRAALYTTAPRHVSHTTVSGNASK